MSKAACSDRLQGQLKRGRHLSTFLSRLDKVRDRGHGQYRACCPAHDDRNPSLKVTETSEGKLLIHCFAGCEAIDIVHAVGLELDGLFADDPHHHAKPATPYERRFNPHDALEAIAYEVTMATVIISDVRENKSIKDEDWQRLITAVHRIRDAREMANGNA